MDFLKRACLIAMAIWTIATSSQAQWNAINLHPIGGGDSFVYQGNAGTQVGSVLAGGYHASLWNGSAESWVDLNPSGSSGSEAYGSYGNRELGYANVAAERHAGIWNGSAASWIDLNPGGATWSLAIGGSGSHQVGQARFGGTTRASLWNGSAESWIDLNPVGSSESSAEGVGGGVQVGHARFGNVFHAGIWFGSAASWVDLNPQGMHSSVAMRCADESNQVGWSTLGWATYASLWHGSSNSWINLSPAGASSSKAYELDGDQQVGWSESNGVRHAGIWSGTSESFVDLHSFLPTGFTSSEARGVWHQGGLTYVAGFATNLEGRTDALIWAPVPEPAGLLVFCGGLSATCLMRLMRSRRPASSSQLREPHT